MSSLAGTLGGAGVLGALAGIAVVDARRMVIRLDLVALLMVAGLCWLFAGGGLELLGDGWWMHLGGAAFGAGMPLALILCAEAAGRRWPIYPGDALLMCAMGGILGLRGFLWALVLGCAVAVLHRACVQTRRGRGLTVGYLAAGPGLAIGAAAVFVAVNAGGALSAESKAVGGSEPAAIAATELSPSGPPLPRALAEREVLLPATDPLPFRDLVAAIGRAAGIETQIEERPARVAGGAVRLPEPGPMPPGEEKVLAAVLDDVAGRAGYAWEWKDGRVVFYRYRDAGWPGAVAVEAVERPAPEDPVGRVWAWLGRVFGSGERPAAGGDAGTAEDAKRAGVEGVAAAKSETKADAGESVAEAERLGADAGDRSEGAKAGKRSSKSDSGEDGIAPETEAAAVETWEVDPASQKTLRGVVESWARKAEWKVDWRTPRDFSVGAAAAFEGPFLKAVDGLFSDPQVSRVLLVSAHANRYLVVREAGR